MTVAQTSRRIRLVGLLVLAVIFLTALVYAPWILFRYYVNDSSKPVVIATSPQAPVPSIGGTVRNETGQPLAAVRVHLEFETSVPGKNGGPPKTAFVERDLHTDAVGHWRFSSILLTGAGSPTVRLERANFGADEDASPISGTLADQTAVFVLSRGIRLSGTVVDQNGEPIADAKVSTAEDRHVVNDPGKTLSADAEGHFAFPPLAAGTITLTTTAKGHAPDLRQIAVAEGMSPVRIVLSPGKTIRGRVVDESGKPVAEATVEASEWRRMRSLPWIGRTDSDGRFIMHDAPEDAVEFNVFKEGYQSVFDAALTAGEAESTLTMPAEPMAWGTVTDADTGKPIPHFEVIGGYTFRTGYPPLYEFGNAKEFSDGNFNFPVSGSNGIADYFLRVEADGYAPAITPLFLASSSFKLALHRSQDLHGRVVGPDGSPVAAAQVVLALPGVAVQVDNNRVRRENTARIATTDSRGEFDFRPQTGKFNLLALCDSGYAISVFDEEPKSPVELRISPWVQIDARFSPGKTKKESSRLDLSITQDQPYRDDCVNFQFQYTAMFAAGRLKLNNVPSFDGNIIQLGIFPDSVGGTYERRWIMMRLPPGQTSQPDLRGATIVGSLISPDGQSVGRTGFNLLPLIESPARSWPTDWFKEKTLPPPMYDFNGTAHFQITGVLPGRYIYHANCGDASNFLLADGILEVRPADVDTTIDMGALTCRPLPEIKIGQPAPEFLGRTLDETPIALRDFTGKFVIGIMWDSDFRYSETPLALIESLTKEFATSPKVALLGLNLDAIDSMGIANRPGQLDYPGWTNGYVSQKDFGLLLQLGGKRPVIFVIDPDGKLAARNVQPTELDAILGRLLAKAN